MHSEAVLALLGDLDEGELTAWIERGWVQPETGEAGWEFLEIDVARARLIHDLRRQMDVAEDTVPLVLSLLDQVYALRAHLRDVLAIVERQSPEVRATLRAPPPEGRAESRRDPGGAVPVDPLPARNQVKGSKG
ncbi:MAG: chaperone modulator CbpM [Acetobacteraceae bacterium]